MSQKDKQKTIINHNVHKENQKSRFPPDPAAERTLQKTAPGHNAAFVAANRSLSYLAPKR